MTSTVRSIAFIFVLFFISNEALADLGPKHIESSALVFYKDNKQVYEFDSIVVFVRETINKKFVGSEIFFPYTDTAYMPPYTSEQFWFRPTISIEEDFIRLFNHDDRIRSFFIVLFSYGIRYESGWINRFPGSHVYRFELDKNSGQLRNVSSLLLTKWSDYFLSLMLTICMELLIAWMLLRRFRTGRPLRPILLKFILATSITHFVLWYLYAHINCSIFLLEAGVFLAELLFWKYVIKLGWRHSSILSFVTNIVSWWVGGLIVLFLSH